MIIFKKCRWKNFLSTGNFFTEIQIDRNSTTLISGENGAGKSTFLDAICFGLFGKPFRKINKPQLVNSINEKNALVEIEFEIGTNQYLVRRGIKPNVFEIHINGKQLDQSASARDFQERLEKQILKMNFKTFTQIVILGSSCFIPFMQLSSSHRRSVIEDILDIEIFSLMNQVLRGKSSELKSEMLEWKYKKELIEKQIEAQKDFIERLKDSKEDRIKDIKTKVSEQVDLYQSNLESINSIQERISEMLSDIADATITEEKYTEYIDVQKNLKKTKNNIEKEIDFFGENDSCTTCGQDLTEDIKAEKITQFQEKLTKIEESFKEIENKLSQLSERRNAIEIISGRIQSYQNQISEIKNDNKAIKNYLRHLEKELNQIENDTTDADHEQEKLDALQKQYEEVCSQDLELRETKNLYHTAYLLLKDSGIKTRIIKQYLPIMNKLVNNYLNTLDFFVNFNLDENFNETIKSRHRDVFSYASFSEGEKQRIDLSLTFAWREIARMRNSVSTNLLIMDEVFDSSLDESGTEDLMKLIQTFPKGTNAFIISHKGDILADRIPNIIKVIKSGNFSQIA